MMGHFSGKQFGPTLLCKIKSIKILEVLQNPYPGQGSQLSLMALNIKTLAASTRDAGCAIFTI